jgi:uncharacterized protein
VRRASAILLAVSCLVIAACSVSPAAHSAAPALPRSPARVTFVEHASSRARRLAVAAQQLVGVIRHYDASYVRLKYPGGDVPLDRGACADLVVRSFRGIGIDLQVRVHEDMSAHFSAYPQRWGLSRPDSNIDQRRVPNLAAYFSRTGKALAVTSDPTDYWPGDIVTWDLGNGGHIGIVSTRPAPDGTRYCVVHMLGSGVRVADELLAWKITGHYRPL